MKDSRAEIIKKTRDANKYYDEYVESKTRTLKQMNIGRLNKKLYFEGYNWCVEKKKLEDATETININGEDIQKKDYVSFKRGFEAREFEDRGFEFGLGGAELKNISQNYKNNSNFLTGYKDGIQAKADIDRGFQSGYNTINLDDVPAIYKENKYFLFGYNKGVEQKENEEKERNSKKM